MLIDGDSQGRSAIDSGLSAGRALDTGCGLPFFAPK